MSIEKLFDHKCDIYHLAKEEKSPGYNLPSAPSTAIYRREADVRDVECHFTIRAGNNASLVQNEPQNIYSARTKLNLPVDTDIRMNDKVVEHDTGFSYTVSTPPRNIRGHHLICYVERTREQKPL